MSGGTDTGHVIWITGFVDRLRPRLVDRPLLVATGTLGLVPVALTLLFLAATAGDSTREFLTAQVLASVVPAVAPAAIWYWDSKVFPRFVTDTTDIAADPTEVRAVTDRYRRSLRDRYLLFTAPWTALIVAVVALNAPYLETVGVAGTGDPAFWLYLLFAAWWGYVTGIGFFAAITAVRTIRGVGALDLRIDPLHPDGLGGLSSVGHLAIWTTMFVSVGSLTLPLAFLLAANGGYSTLVYLAVGLYVVLIVVSFLYPTVYVNRRAQAVQAAELEKRREKIRRLRSEARDLSETDEDGTVSNAEMARRLQIRDLRDEFDRYASVSLYPLSVGILVRLASSVLLPLFFILFETYLSRFL